MVGPFGRLSGRNEWIMGAASSHHVVFAPRVPVPYAEREHERRVVVVVIM